ncbi:MAG: hypothetical protein AB7T37_14965 [Dehalococcoidia bacterium]
MNGPVLRCPRCGATALFRNHEEMSCLSCSHIVNAEAVADVPFEEPERKRAPQLGPAWTAAERAAWAEEGEGGETSG